MRRRLLPVERCATKFEHFNLKLEPVAVATVKCFANEPCVEAHVEFQKHFAVDLVKTEKHLQICGFKKEIRMSK